MGPDAEAGSGGIRSVRIALRLLEEISQRQPAGVSELARALGAPKTSVHRSLETLRAAGWIRPVGGELTRWDLTTKALTVGLAGSRSSGLHEHAVTEMATIRDTIGETVHLCVPDEGDVVVVARLDGTQSLRTFLPLGTRAPLHASASGRALLAAMPDEKVDAVLDRGLSSYTTKTLTDPRKVWRQVRLARKRGYATNPGEWRTGISAIGVPVSSADGGALAAIAISMPHSRYQVIDRDEVAALAIAAAERVSAAL